MLPGEMRRSPRHNLNFSVVYDDGETNSVGVVGDLSETGMFVITNSPEKQGSWLNLLLELNGHDVDMKGLVRWMNIEPRAGRSPGMGIQIEAPPPRYRRYVRHLP